VIRSIAPNGQPDLGGVFRPIDRPRVLERLATAAQYRIATIIAPAGFGKSVAVRQFIATAPSSVVYDVPPDASTLLPFVRGFADALEAVVPALRRSLASAIDGVRKSAAPGRDLATWAATHVRTLDTLIVIDDLHNGEGDAEISRFIAALVDRTKTGPRWLFSSRSPLQLPVASWLAYGESDLVVDAIDLRFSLDEAKQSARATRVSVRDDELEAILGLVDGWPAALTFALRTSTRAADLRAVSAGTRDMVYRYLAEQVWHSLDDRIRSFLRTAAFLPRLETRLAVAAGFDDAAAIIESLRERVAFISVVDAGVYKLHDLFRDFVLRQIGLEGDGALHDARLHAAEVLEAVGMPGIALERYVEARAIDAIERVISIHNFKLLDSGHYDVVERALRVIPTSRTTKSPGVLAIRAAIEDAHGRVEQAEKWYASVLALPLEDISFHISVAWRYALLLFGQARLDALPLLEQLYQRDDLIEDDRAQLAGSLAMTKALAGDAEGAQRVLREALALAEFAGDEVRARTYGRAATVAFYTADEAAIEQYTREATRLATECGSFSLAARLYTTLSTHHACAGRIPVAAWYASQVAISAEKAGDAQFRARGLRELILYEAERGNDERVVELEKELQGVSYRGPVGLGALLVGRGMSLVARRQFNEAQMSLVGVADRDLPWYQHRHVLSMLAVAAAAGQERKIAADALANYDRAVENDDGSHAVLDRTRGLGERFAILANILLGRNAVAQRLFRAVRYRREDLEPFDAALHALTHRSPERLSEALRSARLAGQAGIARLIESVSDGLVESGVDQPATIELTEAELMVLRRMAEGLSNQAIADEQRRTINTVRTHVSSVLRKLNCESRGEAVAIARRLQLV